MRKCLLTRAALYGLIPAAALSLAGCEKERVEASRDNVPAISQSASTKNEMIAESPEAGGPQQSENAAADISFRTPVETTPANSGAVQAASYTMFRDPSCGCCESWADHVHANMKADVAIVEKADMTALKDSKGVPEDLRSCHTMVVDGYVIEGHVPAREIARLLRERPAGIRGLAVPGMPLGSPGMEMGDRKQPYQVIAFGPDGRRVFASY